MTEVKKIDIRWVETIDSTNDEVKRSISNMDNLSVLAARDQTSGRGQRGNTWLSAPGLNLTFSLVIKYEQQKLKIEASNQFIISQIVSLAVVDLLAEYSIEAKIKWPNDIYVGKNKICGILIENTLRGKALLSSIVGIGLNVNQTEFDQRLPNPTSMRLCLPSYEKNLDLIAILERFIEIFCRYLNKIPDRSIELLYNNLKLEL